jgi:hypothetical protein
VTPSSPFALILTEEVYARLPRLLQEHGIRVEPHRDIDQFRILRCVRGWAGVLLSMTKPPHWSAAEDERRNLVVVAAIGESLFRFWRIPRENRLRRAIIDFLRPHAWRPG